MTSGAEEPVLRGRRLLLRPAAPADIPALMAILAEPGIARWWGEYDPERVERERDDSFVIVVGDAVAGWLLYAEETDPDYRHVSLDIMLTTTLAGRGLGRDALRLAIEHFAGLGHHRFTIDPSAGNERAIRSYTAVGFRPVGVLRAYERGPDGRWGDSLLMDLLTTDLGLGGPPS